MSHQHIQRLVTAGKLPLVEGKIDVAAADAVLSAPRRIKSGNASTALLEARLQFETARARREEIKLEHDAGKLVSIADVEQALSKVYGNIRTQLLSFPSKLTSQLVGASRAEIHTTLTEAIRQTLTELVKVASEEKK